MAIYTVEIPAHTTMIKYIEANSKAEAIRIAKKRSSPIDNVGMSEIIDYKWSQATAIIEGDNGSNHDR